MPSQRFGRQTFLVIIDSLLSTLSKCQKTYQKVNRVFRFLCQLQSLTPEEIVKRSSNFIKSYLEDLEESLGEEFVQFIELLKTDLTSHIGTKQGIVELQFYWNSTSGCISRQAFNYCCSLLQV